MITHIYGSDRYRIKAYLQEHAPRASTGIEALKYQSLFDGAQAVVIFDPSEDLEIPKDSDLNIFLVYPPDKKGKKKKDAVVIDNFQGKELQQWIIAEAKNLGYAIAPEAAASIAEQSIDTWHAKLELEKITTYVQTKTITLSDVAAISTAAPLLNIFQFTDALGNQDKRQACILLTQQLQQGIDPFYLFSMMVFQFRNLLAPQRPGVHPFVAQKATAQARRFDPSHLRKLYRDLYQLELDAKLGICDMVDGLYRFVFHV